MTVIAFGLLPDEVLWFLRGLPRTYSDGSTICKHPEVDRLAQRALNAGNRVKRGA